MLMKSGLFRVTFEMLGDIIKKETGREIRVVNCFRTPQDLMGRTFTIEAEGEFEYESPFEGAQIPYYPMRKKC